MNKEELLQLAFTHITEGFNKHHFHQYIGITLENIGLDMVTAQFSMKDELIGNESKMILHGGIISTVFDAVGGMMAMCSAVDKMIDLSTEEISSRVRNLGTISLHVDFLRPGRGEWFEVICRTTRCTNKVVFINGELKNNSGELIAVANNTYYYP